MSDSVPHSNHAEHEDPDHVFKVYESMKNDRHNIDDVNERLKSSKYGDPTLLQLSIYRDDEEFMDYLLSRKDIDVNVVTNNWGLALDLAVEKKKLVVVEKLLEAGTDITQLVSKSDCERTPLYNAIIGNNFDEDIVNLLINYGASTDDVCLEVYGVGLFNPMQVAMRFNNVNAFGFFLNHCDNFKLYYRNSQDFLFKSFLNNILREGRDENEVHDELICIETASKHFTVFCDAVKFNFASYYPYNIGLNQFVTLCREKCQIDVGLMKKFLVDKTNISYYSLLHSRTEYVASELLKIGINIDDKAIYAPTEKLKYYKTRVTYKINKILHRVKMIRKYRHVMADYFYVLPITFTDELVYYLDNSDLVNIALVFKRFA